MSPNPAPLRVPTPDQRRVNAELLTRANQWLAAGRPDKALPLLLQCCRDDAGNLISRQALRTAQYQQRPIRGFFALVKWWRARWKLQNAKRQRDWPLVLQRAEELLSLDPNNACAHLALAQAFEELTLLEHALWSLEQGANPHDPNDPVVGELARLYEQTGRFTKARALTAPRTWQSPEAAAEVERLRDQIALSPTDPRSYLKLVWFLQRSGDEDGARDWLERGLKATGKDFELSLELQEMDLQTLRQDAACAEQKLAAVPGSQELLAILSQLQRDIQARAIEICRQMAERFPGEKKRSLDLGVLLLKAGQFEAALEAFEAAQGDDKLAWRALVYSGYCHLNQNQSRKAVALFEKALPLIPAEEEATRQAVMAILRGK